MTFAVGRLSIPFSTRTDHHFGHKWTKTKPLPKRSKIYEVLLEIHTQSPDVLIQLRIFFLRCNKKGFPVGGVLFFFLCHTALQFYSMNFGADIFKCRISRNSIRLMSIFFFWFVFLPGFELRTRHRKKTRMWPPRQEWFFLNQDTTLHKKKMSRVVTRFLFLRAYRWSRKNNVASEKHFHKFDIHVLLWEIESLFLRPAVASKQKKKTAKSGIGDTRYRWKYENVSSEAISFTLALLQEISNYCSRRSIWRWMRCEDKLNSRSGGQILRFSFWWNWILSTKEFSFVFTI